MRLEEETEDLVEKAIAAHAPAAPIDDIVGMEQYNTLSRRFLVT